MISQHGMSNRPSPLDHSDGGSPKAAARGEFFCLSLIAVLGYLIYQPSLHGGWIWDDTLEVSNNPDLTGGFWRFWTSLSGSDYLPIKTAIQWCQWHLWGPNPFGYHVVSLVAHLVSAWLIANILRALGFRGGYMGAAFFLIHPLAVESVSWISEQKNTLSLPFALTAFWFFLRFEANSSRAALLAAWVLFTAGMLCKSSIIVLPAVIVLYGWWKHGRVTKLFVLGSVPFFLSAAVLGIVTIHLQQARAIGTESPTEINAFLRLARAAASLWFYAGKIVWPLALSPIYPALDSGMASGIELVSLFALPAAFLLFWLRREKWGRTPLLVAGIVTLCLLPIIGLVPMAFHKIAWVSDHLAYLALVAPAAAAGVCLTAWVNSDRAPPRVFRVIASGAILGALTLLARSETRAYLNEKVFWESVVGRNPAAWPAYNNLGNLAANEGQFAEAAQYFNDAIRLRPLEATTHNNLANAQRSLGRLNEAQGEYEAALRLRPHYPEAHYNLAALYRQRGDSLRAAVQYEAALTAEPRYAEAWSASADLLAERGDLDRAIERYLTALRLRPEFAEAHNNLGMALAERGRIDEALAEFKTAVRLKPEYRDALQNIATAEAELRARKSP